MTELTDAEKEFVERVKPLLKEYKEMCKKAGYEQPAAGSYVLSERGKIYHGVPFDWGTCGERNAIGTLVTEETKMSKLEMVLVVGGPEEIIMPCGECRQAIYMWGVENATVLCSNYDLTRIEKFTINKLYPYPYRGGG